MGKFKIEVSRREDDWSPTSRPLLADAAPPTGPGFADAALQSDIDTPEFAHAALQSDTFDTPEFAEAPCQTDSPEFADAPFQTSTPDTPEFAPRNT